jgi:hypothetical protein
VKNDAVAVIKVNETHRRLRPFRDVFIFACLFFGAVKIFAKSEPLDNGFDHRRVYGFVRAKVKSFEGFGLFHGCSFVKV